MSRKRLSGAKGGPSGSCHRAGIHKKGSLVLDAFAPSSPNLPALIQLAGIIVQPVTHPFFDSIDPAQTFTPGAWSASHPTPRILHDPLAPFRESGYLVPYMAFESSGNAGSGRSYMSVRHETGQPAHDPHRRSFLKASGAITAFAFVGTGALGSIAYAHALTKAQRDRLTPDEILALMKKGNKRFFTGKREDHNFLAQQRASD